MQNSTVILEIFDFLKQQKLVEFEHHFSERWLGQNESYLRTLRHKKKEPSLGVVAIIGCRLQKLGEQFVNSPNHSQVGQKFLELSENCHRLVNENANVNLMDKLN
jgi:hypothetical protein